MTNNMADEILDGILGEQPEVPKEPETPSAPSPEKPVEVKEEPKVPLSRLREEVTKRRDAEAKIKEVPPLTAEEEKIRSVLERVEADKKVQQEKEDIELKQEVNDLHGIYGEFDETKLLKIVDEFGVYKENGDINWDKAMVLYQKGILDGEPVAKKLPTSNRASETPQKEAYETKGKSMWQILEETKKELP